MAQNEVATLPARPPATSMADIERLAEAVAKSGMFGIRTRDQALVLMAISQAEGRHPALAARDYDIIQGRPAKKAEAMLRDFLDSGGKVEWHELTDAVADATFSHPTGGSVRIIWDTARAATAGLAAKDMHRKYPRQMLRSRCVSEGVRTVCPMATSGMYVPEEARDIEMPAQSENINAELDQFAAAPGPVPHHDIVLDEAHAAAERGTVAFREFWRDLTGAERDTIREHLATFHAAAKAADDPFGLPPIAAAEEQPPQEALAERPGATPPAGNSTRQGELSPETLPIGEGTTLVVPLPRRPTDEQLDYYARQLLAMIAEEPLTAPRAAIIKSRNEGGIGFLKLKRVSAYDEVMAALNAKVEAATADT